LTVITIENTKNMKNKEAKYKVSVYLVDDKTSYRLRFYFKEGKRFLPQYEKRFTCKNLDEAKHIRDKEQVNDKWKDYKEEVKSVNENDFIAFFYKVIQAKKHKGTRGVYTSAMDNLKQFAGESIPFNKVNRELASGFREYLLSRFAQNTANSRLAAFIHAKNQAENSGEKLIEPFKIQRIPQKLIKRDILTEEEINLIVKLDWKNCYKNVFLFECLTSISFDDLKELKWGQIEKKTINIKGENKVVNRLSFKRGKTGNEVNMILSENIMQLLGEKGGSEERLFPAMRHHSAYAYNIRGIIKQLGIKKHITSHCGRATAIIRVTEASGIYAAAKQAGHSSIETTMRYA
jgi:integrase